MFVAFVIYISIELFVSAVHVIDFLSALFRKDAIILHVISPMFYNLLILTRIPLFTNVLHPVNLFSWGIHYIIFTSVKNPSDSY